MAKIKLDPKLAKEFVVKRYEIVALVAGAVIAVLCLLAGITSFLGASSPDSEIMAQAKKIDQQRVSNPPSEKVVTAELPLSDWPPISPKDAPLVLHRPFFDDGAAGDGRRFLPKILTVDNDPKAFQMDYLRRGIYVYDGVDAGKKLKVFKAAEGATPGSPDPIFQVADKRLVVVSATFPYYLQSEEFKKALRFDDLKEMFAQGLAPAFEGLIVERRKITAQDGKETVGDWESVYTIDPESGKTQVSPSIAKLLGTCIYDAGQVEKYADVIFGASVTPLPMLAGGKGDYPDIKIPAIAKAMAVAPAPATSPTGPGGLAKLKGGGGTTLPNGEMPGMKGGMPGQGMGEGSKLAVGRSRQQFYPTNSSQERQVGTVEFDTLPKDLQDQFTGNVNWTSPYGTFFEEPKTDEGQDPADKGEEPKGSPKDKLRGPSGFGGKGMQGGSPAPSDLGGTAKAPTVPPTSPKALVRFVDTDVVPGAQYQYRIAVRIANPNYKLSTKLVANAGWTKPRELISDWVETPRIAIPEEYQFYVINQVSGFASKLVPNANPNKNVTNDGGTLAQAHQGERVPFQIHKFVGNFTDSDSTSFRYIAEWEIAERILVGKGETLGREVLVEAIQWNWGKGQFEIAASGRNAKSKTQTQFGVMVDFRPSQPIVLLDYVGGQVKYTSKAGTAVLDATCATEALLLMPDGSLIVRNSRHDMDDRGYDKAEADLGGHRLGIERRHRYEEWRSQLEEFRDAAQKANTPTMPKGNKN